MTTAPTRPASERAITARFAGDRAHRLQTVLLLAGAILMPLGIVVICVGWYNMAHSAYQYDELVYLMSGGILGLGIIIVGATSFFAGWVLSVVATSSDSTAHPQP